MRFAWVIDIKDNLGRRLKSVDDKAAERLPQYFSKIVMFIAKTEYLNRYRNLSYYPILPIWEPSVE